MVIYCVPKKVLIKIQVQGFVCVCVCVFDSLQRKLDECRITWDRGDGWLIVFADMSNDITNKHSHQSSEDADAAAPVKVTTVERCFAAQ